jgi:pyruvate kinase
MKNLGFTARHIVKFETKKAIQQMEEIVLATDVVMVARGDLAAEVAPEIVPAVQRQLIELCLKHGKTSIVATQMLLSMTDRIEVSDVAAAVFMGTDAVMLSDETANGKFPIEAVKMMKRICSYNQDQHIFKTVYDLGRDKTNEGALADAVVMLADQLDAQAIVVETKSGATAREIASRRPDRPIIMVTSSTRVAQQLALTYGGMSFIRPDSKIAAQKLTDWLRDQKIFKKGDVVVMASGMYPGVVGTTDTIKVRVLE